DIHENLCYRSHEIVVDYVKNLDVNDDNIYLIGQSLGTGIVVDYAHKTKWKSDITLISPYLSIPRIMINNDIVDTMVAKYQFNSLKKIKKIEAGINIIHGDKDDLIHYS